MALTLIYTMVKLDKFLRVIHVSYFKKFMEANCTNAIRNLAWYLNKQLCGNALRLEDMILHCHLCHLHVITIPYI